MAQNQVIGKNKNIVKIMETWYLTTRVGRCFL